MNGRYARLWQIARRTLVWTVVVILILDVIGVVATARPVAAEWEQVATEGFPAGNPVEISALLVTEQYLYAGTPGNGIFRSADEGNTWQSVNRGLTNLDVLTLAADSETVYVGTRGNGVFRSVDGGNTWQSVNLGFSNVNVYSLVVDGETIYAGMAGSLFRSGDGGNSWEAVGPGSTQVLVQALLVDGQTLYIGTFLDGVFQSDDGGNNWESVNDGLTDLDIDALVMNDGAVFAGTERGVFRFEDGSNSWQLVSEGLTDLSVRTLIVDGHTLYAGTLLKGVFRSEDSGNSWQPVNQGLTDQNTRALVLDGHTLYVGTLFGGVFRLEDNGNSWQPVNQGLTDLDVRALVVDGQTLYAGTSGGVFRSDDGGINWQPASQGLADQAVTALALDGQTLYAGTILAGVFRSEDGGNNWQAANQGLGDQYVSALTVYDQALYAGTGLTGVFRSEDSGNSWQEVNQGLPDNWIWALAVDSQTLYASVGPNDVFRFNERDNSWELTDDASWEVGLRQPVAYQNTSLMAIANVIKLKRTGMNWLQWTTYQFQRPIAFVINEERSTIILYSFAGASLLLRSEVVLPVWWRMPTPYLAMLATTWSGIDWVATNPFPASIGFALFIFLLFIYVGIIHPNRIPFSTTLWLLSKPSYLLPAARYRPYQGNVDASSLLERLILLIAPSHMRLTAVGVEEQLARIEAAFVPEAVQIALRSLTRRGLLREVEATWQVTEPALHVILQREQRKDIAALAARTRQEHPLFSETRSFLEVVGFAIMPFGAFGFLAQSSSAHLPSLYVRLVIGRSLDMTTFQTMLDEVATTFPGRVAEQTALVVIERAPKTGDLHQIFAIRAAKGLTIVPLPQSLIIQGRLDNREAQVLQEQLELYTGRADLYDMRTAVSDVLSFFGRTATLAELKRQLLNGRSMILFGVRKVGKSSLLGRLREECNWPIAVVDLEGYSGGLHYLYQDALAGWQAALKATRPELTLPQWNFEVSADEAAQAQQFRQAVGELLALLDSQPDRPGLLLFLDEMDVLFDQPQYANFAAVLRSLAESGLWRGRFALLVAGLDPRLNRLDRLNEQRNPFFAFFSEQPVGLLEPEDSQTMIVSLGGQMGVGYSDEALALLKEAGGGHPFLTRQLCSCAVRDKERPLTVDETQAKAAIDAYLRQPHNYLAESLWGVDSGGPPAAEAVLLKALAADQPQTEASLIPADLPAEERRARQVALSRLQDQSLIEETDGGWVLTIPLYRRWLRRYILSLPEGIA